MRRAIVLAALGLAACGQGPAAPRGDPAVAVPRPTPPVAAPATTPPPTGEIYRYRSTALRSPFEPSHADAEPAAAGVQPDPHRRRGPLERFRLEQLRLVGGMAAGGQRFALVAEPAGTIHRVAVGDYLGPNHGRVSRLARNELQLREIVRNGVGEWVWRPRSLVAKASETSESAEPTPAPGASADPPALAPPTPAAPGAATPAAPTFEAHLAPGEQT